MTATAYLLGHGAELRDEVQAAARIRAGLCRQRGLAPSIGCLPALASADRGPGLQAGSVRLGARVGFFSPESGDTEGGSAD